MRRALSIVALAALAAAPVLSHARPPAPRRGPVRAAAPHAPLGDSLGSAAMILVGEQLGDRFGDPVAGAGDVNGDGFDDVVVGAWGWSGAGPEEGRAYLFMGSAAGLDSVPAWERGSPNAGAHYGISVAAAGDINRDGYDDVLVGSSRDSVQKEGRAFLFRGGAAGLDTVPAWTGSGGAAHSWFGTCVAGLGDVNGDGFPDVAVGAPNAPGPGGRTGMTFVYYGSAAGLGAAPTVIPGELVGSWFGYNVGAAGDVNGDGFGDVVVGAVYASHPEEWEGRGYLYLGSAAGVATTPVWTVDSDNQGAGLGFAIHGAGDVNADGFADVLAGAHHFDTTGVETNEGTGRTFLYFGSPSGLSPTAPWWITGRHVQAHLGRSVGFAGDVNDDGIDDMFVSTLRYSGTQFSEGRLEVFLGRAGTGPSTIPDWAFASGRRTLALGQAMDADMDINGDGAIDVVAGTSGPSENISAVKGEVYVIYGIPSLLAVPPAGPRDKGGVLGTPAPHPFRDHVRVPFTLRSPGRARVTVYDVTGRAVARLLDADRPVGPGAVAWDGRDARGVRCTPGVYVVSLESPGGGGRRLVALVR